MHESPLDAAADRLHEAERLRDVQDIVRTTARRIVAADGATFVVRDGDNCFYLDEDAISPLWKGQRFPLTRCITGWAMLNSAAAVVPDIVLDARIPLEAYAPTFVRSLVAVPVGDDEPVAAIGAYWARFHRATDDEVARLRKLADATAGALDRIGLDDAPFLPKLGGQRTTAPG